MDDLATCGTHAFCQKSFAALPMVWCIRELTHTGLHLGGDIDTDSLCGKVKAPQGLDVVMRITEDRLRHTPIICKQCLAIYRASQSQE